jgi:hypothetical protein
MSASQNSTQLPSGQASVNTLSDFGEGTAGKAKRWQAEIDTAKRSRVEWTNKAKKVLRRYRDERDAIDTIDRKFNVLWSNIQVMKPALYSKPPKPEVSRKFDTESDPARVAAMMMERNLDYFVCEHSAFDQVMNQCVLDRLLPGQGSAWVRYSANFVAPDHTDDPNLSPEAYQQHEATESPTEESAEHADKGITDDSNTVPTEEKVHYDYVHWQDFLTNVARTWEEVTWVARRAFLTREEGVARFGEKFRTVPLNYKDKDIVDARVGTATNFGPGASVLAKAAVWEIWDKPSAKVYWYCEDHPELLDERKDLLELTGFFPCPRPLLATTTTDSIVPIPDYVMYQDQAQELDQMTNRISLLIQACKVVGVYDKTQDSVQRLLTEGVDNVMIPVDNWAMFAERGGLKGVVDFFPIEMVMQTLTQLIQDRNVIKQDIYEITGIADIVRGASVASETATAQSLKAKFAGIRINDSQKDIARFASDLMNMTAEVMTNFFQPETLLLGADLTPENVDFQYVPEALQLIKSRQLIKHRLTVSVDAITEADDKEEKEARVEFLTALGNFMQQGAQAAESHPELAGMMAHVLLWGVRGFKVGRDIEGVLEQGIKAIAEAPPEPKSDPAADKAAAEMQKMQAEVQIRQQESQDKMAAAQAELSMKQQEFQQELQHQHDKFVMELQAKQREYDMKLDFMRQEFMLKMGMMQQEGQIKQQVAAQDAEIKVQTAQVDGALKMQEHEQAAEQSAEAHNLSLEQQEAAAKQKAEDSDA